MASEAITFQTATRLLPSASTASIVVSTLPSSAVIFAIKSLAKQTVQTSPFKDCFFSETEIPTFFHASASCSFRFRISNSLSLPPHPTKRSLRNIRLFKAEDVDTCILQLDWVLSSKYMGCSKLYNCPSASLQTITGRCFNVMVYVSPKGTSSTLIFKAAPPVSPTSISL